MSAAANLHAERRRANRGAAFRHRHHPHHIPVAVAEKRQRPHPHRLRVAAFLRRHLQIRPHLFVSQRLHRQQFLRGKPPHMTKIKSQSIRRHQRTPLPHMRPQRRPQRRVQNMRPAMVARGIPPPPRIHRRRRRIPHRDLPLLHHPLLHHQPRDRRLRILHPEQPVRPPDVSPIPHLPAALGIKRRRRYNHLRLLPRNRISRRRPIHQQSRHHRLLFNLNMPGKVRPPRPQVFVNGQHLHTAAELLRCAGLRPLPPHFPLKPVQIHPKPMFPRDFGGKLRRKAISVIKHKNIPPGNHPRRRRLLSAGSLCVDHLQQNLLPPPKGFGEPVFLQVDHPQDKFPVLRKLPVNRLETRNHLFHHLPQKRPGQPDAPPVPDRPAYHPTQHIPPPLIPRNHPVADQKRRRPRVFRHHPHREIRIPVAPVFPSAKRRHPGDYRREQVGFINVVFPLQDNRRPLQPHPGVHAGRRQGRAIPLRILVKLHKYQVPKLHEPLAVTIGVTPVHRPRRAPVPFLPQLRRKRINRHHPPVMAPLRRPPVIMYFRAGPGRPLRAGRPPPVILVPVAVNPLHRNPDFIPPNRKGFIIVQVNGHIKPFRRQPEKLRHQLPGKPRRPLLEIIPDAEIPQHLKKSQMLMIPHLVNVGSPKALLTAGQPARRRRLLPHKKGLERHHPRAGKQKRRIPRRNQRCRGHRLMPPPLKKPDE